MRDSDLNTARQVEFIDTSHLNWADVRRTRCQFYQHFQYDYPGPIRDLRQRLMIVPADQHGAQSLLDHHLVIHPAPSAIRHVSDPFGNRVVELEVPEASSVVSFETLMIVESEAESRRRPVLAARDKQHFLRPTRLTQPNDAIHQIARQLQAESTAAAELAQKISDWVYGIMRYSGDVTTVRTTAAEALALGAGLCQDYSHLMLALCRSAGLPARYVSGHLLGEGGSHAWVEVFLPTELGLEAFAFDPTNNRLPHLGYVTVAVGRDYADVAPTSGSFTAPYRGHLTCRKRAGLTMIEYLNGKTVRSNFVL